MGNLRLGLRGSSPRISADFDENLKKNFLQLKASKFIEEIIFDVSFQVKDSPFLKTASFYHLV